MKVSPLAQGTGVPAQSNGQLGQTSPTKIERAKAVAQGLDVPEQSTGDHQVDRARRSIKMRTQRSTNRHEAPVEQVLEPILETTDIPIPNTNEEAEVVEETKPLSPQFAALAKHKRALQVKERELAQREEALKASAPAGQDAVIARLKANPLSVLQEAGVTYDELTEAILNNQSGQSIDPQALRNQIKEELKKELGEEFQTRDQQAEQQVLSEIRRDALALTAQGEQYEAIREAKAQQTVVDLIHRTWKSTGEVMDVTEAAELVENQLVEEALPFAKIKKIQSRLNPTPIEAPAQIPVPQRANTKVMRTLTNRDTASPIMDKRARAIAAMEGRLKR